MYYQKEAFYTENSSQLSSVTILMNFVKVFIIIGEILIFFFAYSKFFSKVGDGFIRDGMEYLKMKGWRS